MICPWLIEQEDVKFIIWMLKMQDQVDFLPDPDFPYTTLPEHPNFSLFVLCTKLEFLDLSHNKVSSIFDDWRMLKNLKLLDLSYNRLPDLKVIVGS